MTERNGGIFRPFLGVGWAFPPELNEDGGPLMSAQEEDVRQAIRIVLATNPGERVMRPDFGAGLNQFVFQPLNTSTLALVKTRVTDALIDWEPRIDVESVSATVDGAEANRLLIEVSYRIRSTNTLHNIVYPFYLEEGSKP